MSGREKEEKTDLIERKDVKGAPTSASLPGFAPRVPPPIPKRSGEEEGNLPFVEPEDFPAGNPPEKKMTQEEMIAAAVAAAMQAMAAANKKPQKPPRPPIDWKKVWEKWESAFRTVMLLALFGLGSWKIPHFIATMVAVAIVLFPDIREWWKKDKDSDDEGGDEKDEKKEEGGRNWLAWVGLLFAAVLIAVIGFVVARSLGVFNAEVKVVQAERTTPAIIPEPEKPKKAERKIDKFACADVPTADLGLACCDKLAVVDQQDCKDFVLKAMDSDGEGSH